MKKITLAILFAAMSLNAQQVLKLNVNGMMCPACVKNVKGAISEVKGVKDSNVYLKDGRAEVTVDDNAKPSDLCDAIKKAGYGCEVSK